MPAEEWLSKPKPLVNFALLTSDNQYFNQIVCLLARVNEGSVDPSGTKVTVETSDRHSVVIRMREPLAEPLTNFVEFICRVGKGGRELECLNYVPIKDDVSEDFDFDQYNRMIEITRRFVDSEPAAANGF